MRTIYLLLLSVVLVCCGQNEKARVSELNFRDMAPLPVVEASYAPINEKSYEADAMAVSDAVQITERKLIRKGRIDFKTKDVARTKVELTQLCESLHAYLSSETQRDGIEQLSYSQTIRVPESGFDELLAKTEKLAQHIDHRDVDTEDVTEEYIDIESRLKTKLALEKRYMDLLNKAHKLEELLQVEKEMSTVREEIESMQGRLNYLRNRVAYSTLNVTYYEEKVVATEFGFGARLARSLGSGWEDVLAFVENVIGAWPVVLVSGVMLLIGVRAWKRRRNLKMS